MSHTHELCLAAELLQRPVESALINHNMPARRIDGAGAVSHGGGRVRRHKVLESWGSW